MHHALEEQWSHLMKIIDVKVYFGSVIPSSY